MDINFDKYVFNCGINLLDSYIRDWSEYITEEHRLFLDENLKILKNLEEKLDSEKIDFEIKNQHPYQLINDLTFYFQFTDLMENTPFELNTDEKFIIDLFDIMIEEWYLFKYNYTLEDFSNEMHTKKYGFMCKFPDEAC